MHLIAQATEMRWVADWLFLADVEWKADVHQLAAEKGDKIVNRIPLFFLLLWSFISTIIFALAIGFAGGVSNVFMGPMATGDFTSIAIWLIAWAVLVAPFALLLVRLVRHLMR